MPAKTTSLVKIKIFTLGRFSLVRDGKTTRFSRKDQQKPLAFLKALIALGGRDVKEDDLSDILFRIHLYAIFIKLKKKREIFNHLLL